QALFADEAEKHHVFPLNSTLAGRKSHESSPQDGGATYTYYAGTDHLYNATAPALENRSHTITAYVDIPAAGADGVLLAFGGAPCGFSLFIKDGKPAYTYNYFRQEITTLAAPLALPAGPATIRLQFDYDGGGVGRGATARLLVNDQPVAEGRIIRTVPVEFSYDETMDVGADYATPVGDYSSPFKFTGTLNRVEVSCGPTGLTAADEEKFRATRAKAAAIRE
ncbi:MAG: arylsulfatase, partial [bacterium]|nr:arylsulfatase [bacterium]